MSLVQIEFETLQKNCLFKDLTPFCKHTDIANGIKCNLDNCPIIEKPKYKYVGSELLEDIRSGRGLKPFHRYE